jgi:DNA polymerase-1
MYEVLKKKDGEAMFAKAGISPRLIELIRDHEEDALFSKMLATIRCDAPVSVDLSKTHRERYDVEQVKKLFSELEFRSLIQRLGGTSSDESTTSEKQHTKHEAIAFPTTPELWEKAKIALGLLDTELSNPSHEDFAAVEGNTPEEKLAHLEKQIDAAKLTKVYRDIELPLIPILRAASNKGILIDREHFLQLSKEYHHELSKAMKEVYRHAGEEFNINSPKQLGIILFDKLALTAKGLKKTEGGARSTRESELEKLRDSHPIIDAVLRYREYQKLLSTYVDAIPTLADKEGRVHTTFHQLGAATGRMATSDPGLQNIPVRDGVGERIRDGFTVPKGKTLLAFDYSQIEMRVLAILSRDEGLLEIFKHEQDVHTSVAARVFKVRAEDVTKDMRRRAKVINFGIIYGMGVSALQRSLGGTRAEAQAFYDDYLGAFPRAAAFLEQTIADAKRLGYTTTLFGRRRSLRDLRSKIPFVRAAAERAAMNAPIQGTAADLVKIAMKHADDALSKTELHGSATFLLQVHDELIYEVDENKDVIMQVVRSIKHACEGVYPNSPIPLSVTTKIGKRWGSMKEYPAQSH